jgi:Flp pilus assembly protein TadG
LVVPKPSTNDRGQATVEFALILPLFILLLVALFEATGVVRDQLLVDVLARDAARVASEATSATEAQQIVADTVQHAGRNDALWRVDVADGTIRVVVSLSPRTSSLTAALSWFGVPHRVSGTATFALEHDIDDL